MKNKTLKLLMLLLLFGCGAVKGQDVNFKWAKSMNMGGPSAGLGGIAIAVDLDGNVYTTGNFVGTVDFDPGTSVFNLTSTGGSDVYISKLNASGGFVWAVKIGGVGFDAASDIALDASGNIYTTGRIEGLVGSNDIFISKFDATGAFVWTKQIGGTGYNSGFAITIDENKNVYITGIFNGTVDFDPGSGSFNLTGYYDIFILKLNALGSFVWVKHMKGVGVVSAYSFAIAVDANGNVYTTGNFDGTVDFDPGPGSFNLTTLDSFEDAFISKLDASGEFVWVKQIDAYSPGEATGLSISVDKYGNVYTTGLFDRFINFYPIAGTPSFNFASAGHTDIYILKLDALGSFVWVKRIGGVEADRGVSNVDANGNVYVTGVFANTVDFDPGLGVFNMTTIGFDDNIFILKLNTSGDFVWAKQIGGAYSSYGISIDVDDSGNIYSTGLFKGIVDFDPNNGVSNLISTTYFSTFILKLKNQNVLGRVCQDLDQNCVKNYADTGLANRVLIINPGNLIVTTNNAGIWSINSLPAGNYTITADTSSSNWQLTCPVTQNFTVVHHDSFTIAPTFGFLSTSACPSPEISIHASFLRPGFSNQKVHVKLCNQAIATRALTNAYVIVELDPLLTAQSSSQPYTNLGNNQYQVNVGTIYPGECVDFWLSCQLSTSAVLGQTLCIEANLYPVDSCVLDTIPYSNPIGIACNSAYDFSHLVLDAECINDTMRFVIQNLGNGDMTCFSQVRIFINGQLIWLDSVQLASGATAEFIFAGNGQTWRIEVDQHPLHYGNSQPSATLENCGQGVWTRNLVNVLPPDDADPIIDIYCGLVTGSYDPNDKTGYPLGVGKTHDILPNQGLEYLIRFQNTGNDTAFTVVIRDTLSMDLNIFSVQSGVSSNDYTFKMHGPRVLEWTFNNIMLPDSNVNEAASHGFVTFSVKQQPNLPIGTIIENSASIYFDYNLPIFTNVSQHTIAVPQHTNWASTQTVNSVDCGSYVLDNVRYNNSGTFWQVVKNNGLDSLYQLNLEILREDSTFYSSAICDSFFIFNNQSYSISGEYYQTLTNNVGCDSTLIFNLIIDSLPSDITIQNRGTLTTPALGLSYQWVDCNNGNAPIPGATNQSFSPVNSGRYAVRITNGTCTVFSTPTNVSIDNSKMGVFVYPNPAKYIIYIDKGYQTKIHYYLRDYIGKTIFSGESETAITSLSIADLAVGIYYLTIGNGTDITTQKIVKE